MGERSKIGGLFDRPQMLLAQVNFSGPQIFFPKFCELSKLRIWQLVIVLRTGVIFPPVGLG